MGRSRVPAWTFPGPVVGVERELPAVALDGRQITDPDGEATGDRFLLLLNAHHEPVKFTIPPGPLVWNAVLTTGGPEDTPRITPKGTITLEAQSLLLLQNGPVRSRRRARKRSTTGVSGAPALPNAGAAGKPIRGAEFRERQRP
jgi:hypothetical protein